nr:hypothetical protein [Tanacetum cinerariifolium]
TIYVGSGSSRKVFPSGPIGNNVDMLQRKVKGKEQIEQAFRQVIEWIRKQFGVEIPPCMGDDDATTPDDAHP